jgi:hypothetical protein
MAENNKNIQRLFKIFFDWCSRISKSFSEKPMLLMSTQMEKRAANVSVLLKNAFPYYGGNIKTAFSLLSFIVILMLKTEDN